MMFSILQVSSVAVHF